MEEITWEVYESPLGPLTLIAGAAGLRGLWFPGKTPTPPEEARRAHPEVTDPGVFDADLEPWRRARVVGAGNGRNPVSIVVPCHRVIGADGSLTGYGGGLGRKSALLELEGSGRLDPAWGTRQTSLL